MSPAFRGVRPELHRSRNIETIHRATHGSTISAARRFIPSRYEILRLR